MPFVYIGYAGQNDVGAEIRLNITDPKTNLPITTGATSTWYTVTKPDNTVATWGAFVYDLNNLSYATVTGDLSQVGQYKINAHMEVNGVKLTSPFTAILTVLAPGVA